jgi:hypothetical protein
MDDAEFDRALIAAFFQVAAEHGWHATSPAAAARAGGLCMTRARERFASRAVLLLRFGRLADLTALAEVPSEGTVRDRLIYLLMRRIDILQAHRAGILALLRALPTDPATALLLALATRRSMRWMLEAAGAPATGLYGELRVKGLLAVWLWAILAWRADETEGMAATEAALDSALGRAESAAGWFGWRERPAAEPPRQEVPDPAA